MEIHHARLPNDREGDIYRERSREIIRGNNLLGNNNKITLIREPHKNQIRGCVTLFSKKRFQHIGKNHRYGKIHMDTLIGRMTDEQLYDEFRFKVQKNLLPKLRG